MILRMFKFTYVAALLLFGLAVTPAAAGGCGYYGCEGAAPVVIQPYVYQSCSCCGCGGSSYYYAYAPANTYPAYGYAGYGGYGYGGYGYGAYGYAAAYGYGAYGYGYAAEYAPRAYVNRFYRPRIHVGPRRAWVR